jgi:aromatic-L-amino-acid/L-tryptophan decarboxylase
MQELGIPDRELSELAEAVLDLARDYWSGLDQRPTYPDTTGEETERLFSRAWVEDGRGREILDDFKTIADRSRPTGPRFFGYVVGSGEPVSTLSELLAATLNQNVTSWRSAPAATMIECTVIGWLAESVGCAGFSGSLCGGGSAANLMALAMAREAKLPANEAGARPCVVYASEQAHMSIPKAVALLGIGRRNLRYVPVDDGFQMQTDALRNAIAQDKQNGLTPIAVVATAGTVATGAIDPLREIADVARAEGLWLHVDGAYGGLAAMAVPERFQGLAMADSISLDAHKWLYQPIDCGCLLHRDTSVAHEAFSSSGDYVRIFNQETAERFAFFDESMELSRRFRALKLWMSLQYHGRRAYRAAIARDLRHALLLADAVMAHPDLELLAPVTLSAVCFRHRTTDNEAILRRVIARGRVYLSNATINGQFALRACFVNHRTTSDDVCAIVDEVTTAADGLDS